MIEGVIFDVDGTILDSMGIWEEVADRYLLHNGVHSEPDLARKLEQMTVPEGCVYIKEKYNLSQSVEEIANGIELELKSYYYNEVEMKKDVCYFLEEFRKRNIPMVIATTNERDYVEKAFRRLNLMNYFQTMLVCSELGCSKQTPEIYLRAAEELQKKPEQIVVFEDVLYAVKTAKAAGFLTAGVWDPYCTTDLEIMKKETDFYLETYSDFDELWKAFLRV